MRLEVPVILDATDRSFNQGFRLIALVYLGIGLYVLFRRWTAPHSTHFFIFCLASFVLYSFKYTGKLNALDQIIYWGNIVAEALQPALFLHFALCLRGRARRSRRVAGHPGLSARGLRRGTASGRHRVLVGDGGLAAPARPVHDWLVGDLTTCWRRLFCL